MSGSSCDCLLWGGLNWRIFLFGRRNFFLRNHDPTCVVSLRYDVFICESKVRIVPSSAFFCEIVVTPVPTVEVIVPLEPLCELKVILIFSLE